MDNFCISGISHRKYFASENMISSKKCNKSQDNHEDSCKLCNKILIQNLRFSNSYKCEDQYRKDYKTYKDVYPEEYHIYHILSIKVSLTFASLLK